MATPIDFLRTALSHTYADLSGIDILTPVMAMAQKVRPIDQLGPNSITIFSNQTDSAAVPNDFEVLAKHGTKFWDAIIYLSVRNGHGITGPYTGVFTYSLGTAIPDYDATTSQKVFLACVLLWLSHGGFVDKSNQNPLPKMVKLLAGKKSDDATREGNFLAEHASFDLRLLDLTGIFRIPAASVGLDKVYMQRIKLSIAGHKPLKAALDLWPLIHVHIVADRSGGSTFENMQELVTILHDKAKKGLTYPRLHPAHKDNLSQSYSGFYKTCLHAIATVIAGSEGNITESTLVAMRSTNMFKQDSFITKVGDAEPGILTYRSTIDQWTIGNMSAALGEPWLPSSE
jgi:hypothetical protein